VFGGIYSFVALVALGTSGPDLLKDPLACYAILAPLAFAGFCVWTASRPVPSRRLLGMGLIAHVLVAPAVYWSLLGLGLGLVVLSYLWWRVYASVRRREAADG
jgi:hypothetical protein